MISHNLQKFTRTSSVIAIAIGFALAFAAVSCTMPQTKIYSLYVSAAAAKDTMAAKDNTEAAGVGTIGKDKKVLYLVVQVDSPRYLQQPFIADRGSVYDLVLSKYDKWDAPPTKMVGEEFIKAFYRTGLYNEIRETLVASGDNYVAKIKLRRCERFNEPGNLYGEIAFDLNVYSPDGQDIYRDTFEKRVKLPDGSFKSLAEGLSSALSEALAVVIPKASERILQAERDVKRAGR
ncbi:MAG: hypothetical protein HQK89_13625 [Nitrospirae bacterium]|nr:hypothetical protein [Nitrospirota bacterium]